MANEIGVFDVKNDEDLAVLHEAMIALLTLLALYAPHVGEYLLEQMGIDSKTLTFPTLDKSALTLDTITMVVQVNGKIRGKMDVEIGLDNQTLIEKAKQLNGVSRFLTGEIKKQIVVPNKLVSFVVAS